MKLVPITCILLTTLSFRIFIINFLELPINHIENPFFLALLNGTIDIPIYIFYFIGLINVLLTYLVARSIFGERIGLLSSFFYGITPWALYMDVSGSIYMIYTFFILVICLSLIKLKQNFSILWFGAIFICILLLFYSNLIIGLIMFLFILISFNDITNLRNKKYQFLFTVLLLLPLTLLITYHKSTIETFFNNQVALFSDPGFINSLNAYQGEVRKTHLNIISKIIENKYSYGIEFIANIFLSNISPVTFFTNQSKMLNFSFSPPIFLALLVPFYFGFYLLLRLVKNNKKWIFLLLLTLPSLLDKYSPNLAKLVVVSPFIFIVIGYGLNYLLKFKQGPVKYFVIIVLVIYTLQFFLVLQDITVREPLRLHSYLINR